MNLRHIPTRLAGLTLMAWAASAAMAQPAEPAPAAPAPDAATLGEIKVRGQGETATGPVVGYRAQRSATATKTDTKLSETPQSVTVVTRDQFVDQGATNVQDALSYGAGIRPDAYGLDSRTDSVRMRGSYPSEYLDGLRKNFEYYTSNARTEPYTLERVEVLRGPSSMLYGQGNAAGVLNMVSKRPQAERAGEIGVQLGRWDRRQVQADFTGAFSESGEWLYRVIGVARDADTQVDYVRDDRRLLAPSLTWRPNAATSVTLAALFQDDKTGSSSQFFPWAGTVASNPNGTLPVSRFIGEPGWDRYDTERRQIGWEVDHRFNNDWSVHHKLRYTNTTNDYRTFYADSFSLPGGWDADPVGQRVIGRFGEANLTKNQLWTNDQYLEANLTTGAVQHRVIAGFDYAHNAKSTRSIAVSADPIDAYAPVYGNFTTGAVSQTEATLRQTGFYVQDQLRVGSQWLVTLGLRHDRARSAVEGALADEQSANTKRAGLMYTFASGWSPYVSYAESFTPQSPILSQVFQPLRGKQWEAGVKYDPQGSLVTFNANVYKLREKNVLRQDPISQLYNPLDETSTHGLELELKAKISSALDVVASYTYTDVDRLIEATPFNIASAWGTYRFSAFGVDGLSVGAGVRYLQSYKDGRAPQVPRVLLGDAMVAWDAPHWRFALNVNNITDKTYIASCLDRGDCWWGTQRNIVATATYKF